MANDINIRYAYESDAQATVTFLRRFRSEALPTVLRHAGVPDANAQREFISSLDGKNGIMLLCLKDGMVVGSLTAEIKRHPQLCHSCELGMGVLQEERGKGVGTALIFRLEEWAATVGVTRLELQVFARNTRAVGFYKKLGFETEGLRKGALKNGDAYEDIILMAKSAEPTSNARRLM